MIEQLFNALCKRVVLSEVGMIRVRTIFNFYINLTEQTL